MTRYSREEFVAICELISEGMSLRDVCKMEGQPVRSTVMLWIAENHDDCRALYNAAKDERIHVLAEETISIADGTDGAKGEDRDAQVRRIRVDARKWYASRMLPKVYGERLAMDVRSITAGGASDADLLAIATAGGGAGVAPEEGEG